MAKISLLGNLVNTCGELPPVGSEAPDFILVNDKLADVTLATFPGKKKLLNIVPSLDTPTCAASTRRFNQQAARLENTSILVVSADLPFAQGRFCETNGLKDVIPLSTFRSRFGFDYGVNIVDSVLEGLTARAIVVIDEDDHVVYTELVDEVADEPDYDRAVESLLYNTRKPSVSAG